MLQVFRSRRMAAIAILGFASGFPFYLTNRALQAWLTVEKVDLSTIGYLSLASLPYSLKFLWAPFLDRFAFPGLGRRRGWLLLSQLLLVVAIAAMTFQNPVTALQWIAVNAVVIAFLSATQDITVDAYRVDTLEQDEAVAGAGVAVLGYRVALIVTGSLAFVLADFISWPSVYLCLAALMAAVAAVTRVLPEPLRSHPPETLRAAAVVPFAEFVTRMKPMRAAGILLFVVFFRFGDALLANMVTPFLIQQGFTQSDIGVVQGGVGLAATIVGALAAGALAASIGLYRSLWICGVLQALSNLAYLALANAGHNYPVMTAAIIIENLCGGLGTAALVGFLTTLCNPRFSATQYALLSSVVAVGRDLLASPAGRLAERTGWNGFFLLTFIAALPALTLLPVFAPWKAEEPGKKAGMMST